MSKCVDLDFDDEKFEEWVNQLTYTDKRAQGFKDFEWNETVTSKQK